MSDIDNDLKEMSDAKAAYEKLMREKGETLICRIVTRMFEVGGDALGTVAWNQWAPYFNDGDPCVFHVRERGFYTPEEEVERYNEGCTEDLQEALSEEQIDALYKLDSQLDSIDDAVFQRTFGSDCQVQAKMVDGRVQFAKEYVEHD
jgi:hypothetical protein